MPVTECADVFSWKSLELWEINVFCLSHPVHATVVETRTGTTGMKDVMRQYKNMHKASGAGCERRAGS